MSYHFAWTILFCRHTMLLLILCIHLPPSMRTMLYACYMLRLVLLTVDVDVHSVDCGQCACPAVVLVGGGVVSAFGRVRKKRRLGLVAKSRSLLTSLFYRCLLQRSCRALSLEWLLCMLLLPRGIRVEVTAGFGATNKWGIRVLWCGVITKVLLLIISWSSGMFSTIYK